MTPEERQRTMDFILASQANSVTRMDRLEANLDRLELDLTQLKDEQKQQKETVDVLLHVTQNLLAATQNVAARTKRLESRSDGFDEMIKVLRELLEGGIRRPEDPKEGNS